MEDAPIQIGMRPSSPGEFIREEVLAELGLSVARAAELLGVRRATLSDLVNGKAALSPEMALRIEKAFGISMDTLLRMQAWHDSFIMRGRADQIDVKRFTPLETAASPGAKGREQSRR
jgi:addiction module HigA family antidote